MLSVVRSHNKRVVISGLGAWCSIGRNVAEFEQSLIAGTQGRQQVPSDRFDCSYPGYRTQAGAILAGGTGQLESRDQTMLIALGTDVALEALSSSGAEMSGLAATCGLCIGTSVGGTYAFVKFLRGKLGMTGGDLNAISTACTSGAIAGAVAKHFGLQGPVSAISTACAAGTNSIGRAFDMVRKGHVRYMLAGGVDIFSEIAFSGFNALQALARGPCRPFDQNRDGLLLGDAGAMLLLEEADSAVHRGAHIHGEIMGYALANEAFHATGPDPTGSGALHVMREALRAAGVLPAQVGYVNAHGTGTKANDQMELLAIRQLLGDHARDVPISSTKSLIGHTLGAAGSIELVATVLGLEHHFAPPTANLRVPMAGYEDLNLVPDRAIPADFDIALSNSFAFGGNVASIVVKRFHDN